jgi:hypothetical protein
LWVLPLDALVVPLPPSPNIPGSFPKKPARPCDALLAPGARAARGKWPSKPIHRS